MNRRRYLVDNNALSRLTPAQRRSDFFCDNCQLTADVLHEARGYVEPELEAREVQITPQVLNRLIEVMAEGEPGDTSLVDLYANKGAADPVMIAFVLEARDSENDTLLPDTWVIVTDDKAVAATASRLGLEALPSSDFRQLFP